jgi:hypothetical protein
MRVKLLLTITSGSNLISVLLSCAIRIAQTLNIHNMGPDPAEQLPIGEATEREIRKRIWIFLCIQDWLLIPFDNSYSISLRHCDTPMPINSDEYSGLTTRRNVQGQTWPTHISYILTMYRGTHRVFQSYPQLANTCFSQLLTFAEISMTKLHA